MEQQRFRGNWNPVIANPKPQSFVIPQINNNNKNGGEETKNELNDNQNDNNTTDDSSNINVPKDGIRGIGAPHLIDSSNSKLLQALLEGKLRKAAKYCQRKESRIHDTDTTCNFPAIVVAASMSKASPLIEFMLEKNVSPNICCDHGNAALRESMFSKDIKIARILIKYKADVNQKDALGETPIYVGCQTGFLKGVRLLRENGAKLNQRKEDGGSNLTAATSYKHIHIVKWLLKKGEKPNSTNKYGATPLIIATQKNCIEIVEILLAYKRRKVKLNKKIIGGFSALSISILQNNYDIFRLLLEAGSNIHVRTDKNASTLFLAVQCGNLQMTKDLLEKGVDMNIKFQGKYTALQLAKSKKYHDIYDLLQKKSVNS